MLIVFSSTHCQQDNVNNIRMIVRKLNFLLNKNCIIYNFLYLFYLTYDTRYLILCILYGIEANIYAMTSFKILLILINQSAFLICKKGLITLNTSFNIVYISYFVKLFLKTFIFSINIF